MSEDFKIQLSFKPQNRLDNIRANSWEEMDALLAGYGDRIAMINAIENIATSGVAGAITPPSVTTAPLSAPAAPVTPAPSQPQGHTCKHGAMVYRTSKPDAAKAWKGYFCPAPKGTPDQCEPQFVR